MKINDLLKNIAYLACKIENDIDLGRVTYDSRKIEKNGIFVAIKGKEFDGHKFIEKAIENGAKTIVHTSDVDFAQGINYIKVKDARQALADISNCLSDFPSKKLRVIGVTGTNGKTSTANIIYHIFKNLENSATNIGTDGTFIDGEMFETANTTPEVSEINEIMVKSLEKGVKTLVLEASSHGLFLERLRGVDFDWGVFTNLSMEHMDFHKNMENYFAAKMILLENSKKQVINIDDDYGKRAKEIYKNAITFSIENPSDYRAENIKRVGNHLEFDLKGQKFLLKRFAKYDIYNSLPGIIIAHQEGFKLSEIAKALESLGPIESRFEFIENNLGINIVIDFAHTPKAFDNIFSAIPKDKNIIAVYGMSGDRTKEIRQKVGEISASHKVFSVVTTDDPKFDTYENIANDIVSGIVSQKGQYIKIIDRKEAIAYAIKKAEPGDFLLLLGKGEEHFMKLDGNNKTYYNEKESVREILDKI